MDGWMVGWIDRWVHISIHGFRSLECCTSESTINKIHLKYRKHQGMKITGKGESKVPVLNKVLCCEGASCLIKNHVMKTYG
jgi:hypothetical protein